MSYIIEDNVIKGQEIDFDFAEFGGLGNILFTSMKKYGQNIAQIDPESDRKDTYEYVLRHSVRAAMVMTHIGIKKGDIVMGCSDNHLDACVPITAALFLGAVPCSIDYDVTILEMTNMLNQVKPKMIFAIPSLLERITEACLAIKLNPAIVVFGNSDKYIEFQYFIKRQPGEEKFEPVVSHDPKETAIIYFSSGISGLAKACCLSHAYFIKQSSLIPTTTTSDQLDLERRNFEWSIMNRGGSFLCYSPLYWITGGKIFFDSTIVGLTRVLPRRFDPKEFWYIVEKYKVLWSLLAPFYVSELVKHGRPSNVNIGNVIKLLAGGSPLQKKHWKLLQDMLPDTDIEQCYGLTETGVIMKYEPYNKAHREYYRTHPESVGFPTRGVWYKVVNPDTEEILGPNQEGELRIKSKYFMNGYYNKPCDEEFDSEGWFKTGDVVYYTDKHAFYITDRLKELIRNRVQAVYPYVLEKELLQHPAVAQAVVFGVPHEVDVERPAAFIILNDNFTHVSAEEIRKFIDERVQEKAKLRGGVRIVTSFPKTSTGKIKRIELRRMILQEKK